MRNYYKHRRLIFNIFWVDCAYIPAVGVFFCIIMMAASVSASESLSIHYQPVAHMDNNIIQIGVAYTGPCNKLQVQAFMEQDVLNNTFNHMVGEFSSSVSRNTSFSIVTVPDGVFANNDTVIRIVAMNGSEICSDMESQQSFYCFFPDSTYNNNVCNFFIATFLQDLLNTAREINL